MNLPLVLIIFGVIEDSYICVEFEFKSNTLGSNDLPE